MQEENANESGSIRAQWKQLNKEQKIAIIALVIGAGFVFVFSALRVRQGIYSPFLVPVDTYEQNRELIQDPIAEYQALQKRTDSDGDGLSDWSEENIYKTSPYLWSTAGDSVPDNVKIARGENPLCKSGEPCDIGTMNFNLPTTTLPFNLTEPQGTDAALDHLIFSDSPAAQSFQEATIESGADFDSIKSQLPKDPELLRKTALESGRITQEELDLISDEDLIKLYTDALDELEKEAQTAEETTQ